MSNWSPLSRDEIDTKLAQAMAKLSPEHRRRFASICVPPRSVPVAASACETVWVVAEHDGMLIYYSDIEDGWALSLPDDTGGVGVRDSSQFDLRHIAWHLFGDPRAR